MYKAIAPSHGREEKVLVIGVGGGTRQIIELVHAGGLDCVDTLFLTTDESDLTRTRASHKVLIGRRLCGGKGAMGLTELGERSADDAKRDLEPLLRGYPLIVQVATLGKGTASGASPVVASIGEGLGSMVLNVLVMPSSRLESMPRAVANHARNRMLKRNFNILTIDQDRFMEMNGNQPFPQTMAALDALLSWIILSLADVVYGSTKRSLTVSDLRSVFKEGNEGTVFIGGSGLTDPVHAAEEFVACGLLKRDPRTGRGLVLNLVTPKGAKDNLTRPFIDALIDRVDGRNKTIFIGSLEDPARTDVVDLIGIITGMDDGSVKIPDNTNKHKLDIHKAVRPNPPPPQGQDKWEVPIFR